MGLISWIILGGLAGWLGSKIMKTDFEMSKFKTIAVGVVGAIIGGGIMSLISKVGMENLNLNTLLVAFGGSIILLLTFKKVHK